MVYWSSKQGKTSLILKHLKLEEYIKIECSPQTTKIDIYKSILRQSNIVFSEVTTTLVNWKEETISWGGWIQLPLFGSLDAQAQVVYDQNTSTESRHSNIDYNLNLAQDIIEILQKNNIKKYIILDNFHYLPEEIQKELAFDLRLFQDNQIIFIILWIRRESNRMIQFNWDLLDRITEVPVEPRALEDFYRVIEKGEKILNIDFDEVKDDLIHWAYDSIWVVQELCKQCCEIGEIYDTQDSIKKISEESLIKAFKRKSDDYGARHIRNFESFTQIPRRISTKNWEPSLAIPYYIIKVLITIDIEKLEWGITKASLIEHIRKVHHRGNDVRPGDVSAFLNNITRHQLTKSITPPFLDYDKSSRVLKIIDSTLYFYLKYCNKENLLEEIKNPILDQTSSWIF